LLFTEAAEGGAGVLRRLQSERDALAKAARQALLICHFNADGSDQAAAGTARPCAKGCYDCLLTYGNQGHHGVIDRHSVIELLLRLAKADVRTTGHGETRTEQMRRLSEQSDSRLEREFVAWLKERGLRLPDEAQTLVADAGARPDFVYRLPGVNLAVFVDGPIHDHSAVAERDKAAEERLYDRSWDVVRFRYDADWEAVVAEHPRYFGTGLTR
jgi:very-short-patch-repair endonuclease